MTFNNCTHETTLEIHERCFTGPVGFDSGPLATAGGQNRAAHGGVTSTTECRRCGARRLENHNGHHVELGQWWDDRRQKAEAAAADRHAAQIEKAALDGLRAAYNNPRIYRDENSVITVQAHADGPIVIAGSNLADAWRRAGTSDAETIRKAMLP